MMLMLAAAVIAAHGAQTRSESRVMPDRQAQAMVRIVSAAVIDFEAGRITSRDAAAEARETPLRLSDGSSRPAKLLEFQ